MAFTRPTPEQINHELYLGGSIPKPAFLVVIGAFFGMSVLSFVVRMGIRISTRRRLFLDDYIVLFGLVSLTVATGILYYAVDIFFVNDAVNRNPLFAFYIPAEKLNSIIFGTKYLDIFLATIWTTTFAVKFSFLAFFEQLTKRVFAIRTYLWTVVGITFVSWLFLVSEPFILCPYFGMEAIKCRDPSRNLLYVSMAGLVTGLDVLTDILIVSIPIIILWSAKIKLQQKFALGIFLSLSLVMVVIAIIRVAKIHNLEGVDLQWEIFWQYMEGAIAILMASITAFRTVFVSQGRRELERLRRPSYSVMERLKWRRNRAASNRLEGRGLPEVPGATLTGMRTFIRRNNRSEGVTTPVQSEIGTLDEEEVPMKHYRVPEDRRVFIKRDWSVFRSPHTSSDQHQTTGASAHSSEDQRTLCDSVQAMNYTSPSYRSAAQGRSFV